MTEMTWQEFGDAVQSSLLVLCTGSVEQHGPHMPLDVDLRIPYGLGLRLCERVRAVLAPPVYYAGHSQPATGGGQHFPGTTAIRGHTLSSLIGDILADFARQGCRRFLVLNGHFENTAFIAEAAREESAKSGVKVVVANWWEMVPDEALRKLFPAGFPGWEVEHASLTETSLMMYMHPDLVHIDRIPPQQGKRHQPTALVFPEPAGLVPETGILYTAEGASESIGEALTNLILERLLQIVAREFPDLG
jgi:creatinine amidohydrolase